MPHRHVAPRLALVGKTRRTRPPLSATLALFAAGMTPGFLLASIASAQGGAGLVHSALLLAGTSALVAVAAATRARQIERRRERRIHQRAAMRPPASAHRPMRHAA
jgi:hypothetical protein